MAAHDKVAQLTPQAERILKLLFKFRFVTAQSLAHMMGIQRVPVYRALERLVTSGLVVKVYDKSWRIDRRPAYYYLGKSGVTMVRALLGVKESVVHSLYKNDTASPEFIGHCLTVLRAFPTLARSLPKGSALFTRAELQRFTQFPRNRPDLFIRTPSGQEAMIIFVHDVALYLARKRLDEILRHSEDEAWVGDYPLVAFILPDERMKYSFLYGAASKLDNLGFDAVDLTVVAASLTAISEGRSNSWSSAYTPTATISLLT